MAKKTEKSAFEALVEKLESEGFERLVDLSWRSIKMTREAGVDNCFHDAARPLYSNGRYLAEAERGPKCPHQHVQSLACKKRAQSHKHRAGCYINAHVNVECDGWEITAGKLKIKVFADAPASELCNFGPAFVSGTPSSYKKPNFAKMLAKNPIEGALIDWKPAFTCEPMPERVSPKPLGGVGDEVAA